MRQVLKCESVLRRITIRNGRLLRSTVTVFRTNHYSHLLDITGHFRQFFSIHIRNELRTSVTSSVSCPCSNRQSCCLYHCRFSPIKSLNATAVGLYLSLLPSVARSRCCRKHASFNRTLGLNLSLLCYFTERER